MEKVLKRKSKKIEVFEKTHTKKGSESDEVVWCDDRAKETTRRRQVRSRSRRRSATDRARHTSRRLAVRKGRSMVLSPLAPCTTRRRHCPRIERDLPRSIHMNSSSRRRVMRC